MSSTDADTSLGCPHTECRSRERWSATGFRGVQLGNADIARTERALPCPDPITNTLPIYPKPADLPGGGAA